jgi:hypothetical protein
MQTTEAPTRLHRGVLAVAVTALLALGIGAAAGMATGGDDAVSARTATAVPLFSLASATESTLAARTVEFELTATLPGVGDAAMSGVVDNETGLVAVRGDVSDLLPDTMGTELPLGGEVELIVADDVAYVGASGLSELLPIETPWISLDLAVLAEKTGTDSDDLPGIAIDPRDIAQVLLDADDVTEIGPETIDGEETVRSRVVLDLGDPLASLPEMEGALDEQLDGVELPETVSYDVWVTADNELRRVALDLDVAGQGVGFVLDLTTSDEPPAVEIPADAFDLTAWLDW